MIDPQVNFFSSTLVGTYSASDTSLTIATGSGELLPDPSVDGAFNLVIYNESAIGVVTTYDGGSTDTRQDLAGTNPEIVRVTARSGDVLTVTRGQEGTTASVKEEGNTYRVILSATKKIFDDIQTAIDNVNVTNLTGVESLVFDTTGDEEFGLPVGTTAQRPASPSQGYMRYNTDDGIGVEVYNGSRWVSLGAGFAQLALEVAELSVTANDAVFLPPLEVEYLVIAGGGSGGSTVGGGGGAGGYRSSVTGESSGGGASAESVFEADTGVSYTVTVGAGGASVSGASALGNSGSNSVFSTITSDGGGGGGHNESNGVNGGSGSGGGGRNNRSGGSGTANQGFDGADSLDGTSGGTGRGGGGGGAGSAGVSGDSVPDGGNGVSSSITGTSVGRAGGGGGGAQSPTPAGSASDGGGGGGASSNSGTNGTANTGGGGGGNGQGSNSGSGGSGVVILRYPSFYSITVGAGLTGSTATVGANKVTTFTAGTDTISFS